MKTIYRYINNFGIRGLLIAIKLKLGLTKRIFIPKIPHPIYLRSGTSDASVFTQVFGSLEYNINIRFQPETIIDAGANIGLAAVYFINKYPKSKIISVEPENSNFELLQRNVSNYKSVHTIQRAISNKANQYVNVVDDDNGEWGFTTEVKEESDNKNVKGFVKTITIGEIMEENELKQIDILKIDIEGAEKELFESAFEKWMPKTRCIIIELHDGMKKGCSKSFFKVISQYNFSLLHKGENLVFLNQDKIFE